VSTERPLPTVPRGRGRHGEVWVGAFVIAGVIAAWFVLATLTEPALFRGRYILKTNVPSAAGIRKGDSVQMHGVNIGRVLGFRIRAQGVELRLEIEGEYEVPSDSRVELRSSGLLAGMVAEIIGGKSARMARGDEELPGTKGVGLLDKMDSLAGEADNVTARLQRLMSDETIRNVQDGSGAMRRTFRELAFVVSEQRGEIKALSASLLRSAEGLEKVTSGPELERTMKQMDELAKRIDGVVGRMDRSAQSLDQILARVDRGEGTLGKLARDEALYDNLARAAANFDKATVEMQVLVADVRREPKKYITLKVF
jgi:phospholipid/cholesterol/gamma-HCH transport system substrate-binding protein